MSPWLAFGITLSLIILVHEWGHFVVARRVGVKVECFSIGFGPKIIRFTRAGTEYVVSLIPLGGYVKMVGESPDDEAPRHSWEFRSRSTGQRLAIILAGPLINYLVGFLLFFFVFMTGAPSVSAKIGKVLDDFPAAQAGLKEGDRILSINGRGVDSWEEVTNFIHKQMTSVSFTVERGGEHITLSVEPKIKEATNLLGAKVRLGMVGISPSDEVLIRRYPAPQAFAKALERISILTQMTLQALWRMLTGGMSIKESVTGPIGIFYITSSVAQQGLVYLLQLIAVLSTSLGLFNLLPIPVLDGGHVAFLIVEFFKGKPVSIRSQEAFTRVGLVLLGLLLLVVTYNDFVKFGVAQKLFPFLGRN